MPNNIRFIPKRGLSDRMSTMGLEDGAFVISLDDKKLYIDAYVDGVLQRVPLGGDISTAIITWAMITNKPFSLLDNSDFAIKKDTLSVNDNLKFLNKEILDEITIPTVAEDRNFLYDTYPILTESYNTNIYEAPSQQDIDSIILNIWRT